MSWLAEFAGKAENLLNKIDQNAAVALSSVNERKSRGQSRVKPENSIGTEIMEFNDGAKSISQSFGHKSSTHHFPDLLKAPSKQELEPIPSEASKRLKSSPSYKTKANLSVQSERINTNTASRDDELIEFLNSDKQFDETSILKTELSSQGSEISLLVKKHKRLQQDYDTLKASYDNLKFEHSLPSTTLAQESQEECSKSLLEQVLQEKELEIQRLSERLDQVLRKLQILEQASDIQDRLDQVELENKRLVQLVEETSQKYNNSLIQSENTNKQAQLARDSLLAVQADYFAYKNKANNILKSKDEVIATLESRQVSVGDEVAGFPSPMPCNDDHFAVQINTLRNEKELFQAEVSHTHLQVESLKEENTRLENELLSLRSINFDLQNVITKERKRVQVSQEENLHLSQANATLQLELEREKLDKKKLVEKHQRTSSNPMTRSSSSSELQFHSGPSRLSPIPFHDSSSEENQKLKTRITAMSQSLLEKQSLINELSTDKQLLQIRVERLDGQIQELSSSNSYSNDGISTTSVISRQPLYLSESPWDSSMALRMKRVYSHMDSLCCQFGLAMRQRPTLRLGFTAYILVLHVWVFFVLFYCSHEADRIT